MKRPLDLTEKQFLGQVEGLARAYRWRKYHTWNAMHSTEGFPDLVLLRGRRLIFAELKSRTGRIRPGQEEWLAELREVRSVSAHLWRPEDWETIEDLLSAPEPSLQPGLWLVDALLRDMALAMDSGPVEEEAIREAVRTVRAALADAMRAMKEGH